MRYLSLFSGIGGLDLAAHWVGFRPAAFVERDSFCQKVLAKHWPGTPIFDDVRTFNAAQFLGITLIIGGFPCQDISAAGKGAGLQGERSGLWFEYLRIIKECRPRFVVAENVGALISRGIDVVLCGLEEAGYTVEALRVGADDMGAPHERERWFIVGERIPGPQVEHAHSESVCAERGEGHARSSTGTNHNAFPELPSEALANLDSERQPQQIGPHAKSGGWDQHSGEEVADTERGRLQRGDEKNGGAQGKATRATLPQNGGRLAQSRVGGTVHGLSPRLDESGRFLWPAGQGSYQHDWEAPRTIKGKLPNRPARIKALGNAVVPSQALPVFIAIRQRIEETKASADRFGMLEIED